MKTAFEKNVGELWTVHIALTGELDESSSVEAFSIMQRGFAKRTATMKRIVIKSCVDGEVVSSISI